MDIKQKSLLMLTIAALGFLAYQIFQLVDRDITENPTIVENTIPSSAPSSFSALPSTTTIKKLKFDPPKKVLTQPSSDALNQNQHIYVQMLNQFELVKLHRQLLDEETAVATAENQIAQLHNQTAKITGVTTDDTDSSSSTLSLSYVDQQDGQWSATLHIGTDYQSVTRGSVLSNGYVVTGINHQGVILQKNQERELLTFDGISALPPLPAAVKTVVIMQPAVLKPAIMKPVAVKFVLVKSPVAKPVVAKPVVAKPVVAKPVVAKPVVAKPVVAKLVTAKLPAIKPVAAQVSIKKSVTPVVTAPVPAKVITTSAVAKKMALLNAQPKQTSAKQIVIIKKTPVVIQKPVAPVAKPMQLSLHDQYAQEDEDELQNNELSQELHLPSVEIQPIVDQQAYSVNSYLPQQVVVPQTYQLDRAVSRSSDKDQYASESSDDASPAVVTPAHKKRSHTKATTSFLSTPAHYYTIQLIGSPSVETVHRYVRANKLGQSASSLLLTNHQRPWMIVVYGIYSTEVQARAACAQLPKHLRANGAWVREVGDIQRDIK